MFYYFMLMLLLKRLLLASVTFRKHPCNQFISHQDGIIKLHSCYFLTGRVINVRDGWFRQFLCLFENFRKRFRGVAVSNSFQGWFNGSKLSKKSSPCYLRIGGAQNLWYSGFDGVDKKVQPFGWTTTNNVNILDSPRSLFS